MSDQAHSPAPFALIKATREHGHLILDALGDSIGALAWATGDHEPEEQLANAILFGASPGILKALKAIQAVRPVNWDDDEDAEALLAWKAVDAAIQDAERPL